MTHRSLNLVALVCLLVTGTNSTLVAQDAAPVSPRGRMLAADAPGDEIYRQACAACHGVDGTGQPRSVVGFQLPLPNGHDLPDFTDCATNTVEPMADWLAVVHRGGPIRALDRRMPAFGEALTESQIELALRHIWTFCDDSSWPRGDLNLPRAFFTEKAFPENETVWTTGAFMVRMFSRYRHELGVEALPSELEATARATTLQLQRDTATVNVTAPKIRGNTLVFDVDVRNLTGHKFPTGYPSRRAWLHVTVRDSGNAVVFESGAVDASGAIAGNDNDAEGRRYEPHYQRITAADQVQIYETILGDLAGAPTTGLLTATQYLKDNRLLPRGFDKTTAPPEIQVSGHAAADADLPAAATGCDTRSTYLVRARTASRSSSCIRQSRTGGRRISRATTPRNPSDSSPSIGPCLPRPRLVWLEPLRRLARPPRFRRPEPPAAQRRC